TRNNQDQVLQLLIENGANVNAADKNGFTALHIGAEMSSVECVQLLLKSNIGVNLMNEGSETALMIAIRKQEKDENVLKFRQQKIIQLLMDAKEINFNVPTRHSFSVNHLIYAARFGNVFAVEKLIEKDANLNYIRRDDGELPIHCAAGCGHNEVIKTLVRKISQFNINVKGGFNRTAAHVAVFTGTFSTVELLSSLNANFNAVDAYGDTPLHYAVKNYQSCSSNEKECVNTKNIANATEIKIIYENLNRSFQRKQCACLALVVYLIEKCDVDIYAKNKGAKSVFDVLSKDTFALKLIETTYFQKPFRNGNKLEKMISENNELKEKIRNLEKQVEKLNADFQQLI
ncbi:E3 ubiquitin-protein ligase MIB2-like protein, partial [Leptotrombidium deliense]